MGRSRVLRRATVSAFLAAFVLAADRSNTRLRLAPQVRLTGVQPSAFTPPRSDEPTSVSMRNVGFRVADGIVLRIHRLDGVMRGTKNGIVDFDDKSSYVTEIVSGEVGLTGPDLTNLMNRYVFAYAGAPLKRLRLEIRGNQLRQTGIMHKGVDIPFDMIAEVTLTADNRIRIHPTRMRILGVNGAALMKAFDLTLEKLLNLSKAKGITVRDNDLFLGPTDVLPPPTIRRRVTAVRFAGDELVQIFGSADTAALAARGMTPPDASARNYMYYRGGTLHFGKLFMADAEMLVVDQDLSDPFDFDNDHYHRQLIAGSSRTLPSLGLEVYMPDAAKVKDVSTSTSPRTARTSEARSDAGVKAPPHPR